MYAFPSLLRDTSTIDAYMERARALKHEEQIFPQEVRHLIRKLDASLPHAQAGSGRRKVPGSRHSYAEVTRQVEALRSVLLAAEVVKKTRDVSEVPIPLQNQAKNQLLRAILAL